MATFSRMLFFLWFQLLLLAAASSFSSKGQQSPAVNRENNNIQLHQPFLWEMSYKLTQSGGENNDDKDYQKRDDWKSLSRAERRERFPVRLENDPLRIAASHIFSNSTDIFQEKFDNDRTCSSMGGETSVSSVGWPETLEDIERLSTVCRDIQDWVEEYVETNSNLTLQWIKPPHSPRKGVMGVNITIQLSDEIEPEVYWGLSPKKNRGYHLWYKILGKKPRFRVVAVTDEDEIEESRALKHKQMKEKNIAVATDIVSQEMHDSRKRWGFWLGSGHHRRRVFPETALDPRDTEWAKYGWYQGRALMAKSSSVYWIYYYKPNLLAKPLTAKLVKRAALRAAAKHDWFNVTDVQFTRFE